MVLIALLSVTYAWRVRREHPHVYDIAEWDTPVDGPRRLAHARNLQDSSRDVWLARESEPDR